MEKNKRKTKPPYRIFQHPSGMVIVICGKLDDDAKMYAERSHACAMRKIKSKKQPVKANKRYRKIVKWSDEDLCYIGTCPGLFYGGCHGDNEAGVYEELCKIVDEVIQIKIEDGDLPPDFQLQKTTHAVRGKVKDLPQGKTKISNYFNRG